MQRKSFFVTRGKQRQTGRTIFAGGFCRGGFTLHPRAFSRHRGGFTLIELMISIAILVIMTTAMLLRQRQIDSIVRVRNVATEIVQMVRQAQVYGINKKSGSGGINSGSQSTFGIYFDTRLNKNQEIILFDDTDHNHLYIPGEKLNKESRKLPNQVRVVSITCGVDRDYGSVTFTRPFPDASLRFRSPFVSSANPGSDCGESMTIKVGDTSRDKKIKDWEFTINSSGQITKPKMASTPN